MVTFHGGGFVQGTGAFTLPPSAYPILNVSSSDILFVYPNYRLNAFGFLPGREVADDPHSDTNAGLRDQRAVLEWVQKHIVKFGGDPENVTIWGQSAGGGSVLAHTIAKQDAPLFSKAWASSPFWPKTYEYDSVEAQAVYDQLADLTGCTGPDSLQCLKAVDVQTIRDANLIIRDSQQYGAQTFTWAPVLDHDFLPRPLSEATATGHVNLRRGVGMYNTHEGESFIPPFDTSSPTFDDWLRGYQPKFSSRDIAMLKKLYPPSGRTETEVYNTTFARAGMVYRDSVLACPAYWMADAAPDGWLGEYTMSPSRHADDVYWWNTVNDAQKEDPLHYEGYSGKLSVLKELCLVTLTCPGAFASFFATGDPNKLKLTASEVVGLPNLRTGKEWVIEEEGFDTVKLDELKTRCHFWRKMASKASI